MTKIKVTASHLTVSKLRLNDVVTIISLNDVLNIVNYLKEQGLTSLRILWIKIHHPATAR